MSDDDKTGDEGVKDEGVKKEESTSGDAPRMYTPEEYEALQRRMQAADRTATEKQNKLDEIENASKGELERAKDALAKAAAENAKLKESNKTTLMKAEFGLAGGQWHNPTTAYNTLMADYSDLLSVDDDGKVLGMKAAVDKLTKEHAYLVKAAEEKKDEKDEASAATGPVKNGKRKGDEGDTAMDEALRKRLPALAAKIKAKN
jgi:hypothetical protein